MGSKRVAEFNIDNGKRTLKIIVNNSKYSRNRMLKPSTSIREGKWVHNQLNRGPMQPRIFT